MTDKQTFSPGPWAVFTDGTENGQLIRSADSGPWIAVLSTTQPQDSHNARLIAEAPSMYEALQFALMHLDHLCAETPVDGLPGEFCIADAVDLARCTLDRIENG